jgi:hypothetical protein
MKSICFLHEIVINVLIQNTNHIMQPTSISIETTTITTIITG